MQIAKYLAQRLLTAIFTLWLVSIAIFAIVEVLPGDISRLKLGPFATQHDMELIRIQLGLNRPIVDRYFDWAHGFVIGEWGNSWRTDTPLFPLVMSRLGNSAILAVFTLLIVVPLSILFGVIAALRRNRLLDHVITLGGICGLAVPEFVSSMFLILFFSLWLNILPSSARPPEEDLILYHLNYLILPICALCFVLFGYISRIVRANMIDELRRAYVRTARLKGMSELEVITRHVLRNALLPTVTVIANQVSWLIGGLVVVENIFNYPGLGQLLLQAATGQDVPTLEDIVLIIAALLMLANFTADLLYGLLNPRVRIQPRNTSA